MSGCSVLKVCQALMASFSRSWKKQRDLVKAQKLNLPIHKLKVDLLHAGDLVMTYALEQLKAIRMVLCNDCNSSHQIPAFTVVKSLKAMTDALSGEVCHYFYCNTIVESHI